MRSFLEAAKRNDISPVSTLVQSESLPPIVTLSLEGEEIQGSLAEDDATDFYQKYYDEYQFQGKAGQQITLEMTSQELNSLLILSLPDQEITNDDRGAGDFNAQIVITLPADGMYTVKATSHSRGETGNYTLKATINP